MNETDINNIQKIEDENNKSPDNQPEKASEQDISGTSQEHAEQEKHKKIKDKHVKKEKSKSPEELLKEKEELIKQLEEKMLKAEKSEKRPEILEKAYGVIGTGVEAVSATLKSGGSVISAFFKNAKLKSRIPFLRNKIEKEYIKIGRVIYGLNEKGTGNFLQDENIIESLDKVAELKSEIKKIKEEVNKEQE